MSIMSVKNNVIKTDKSRCIKLKISKKQHNPSNIVNITLLTPYGLPPLINDNSVDSRF